MTMNRQRNDKASSFFYRRVQLDLSLVSLNNSPTNRQPHATSIRLRSQAIERFEDTLIFMLRYSITIVDDLDAKYLGSFPNSLQDHINICILRAVPRSILNQIIKDVLQLYMVSINQWEWEDDFWPHCTPLQGTV